MKLVKRLIYLYGLLLLACVSFSCSQDGMIAVSVPTAKLASNKFTPEEAKENALEFISMLNANGTRGMGDEIKVSDVTAVLKKSVTRGSNTSSTDTMYYVVNFCDSCGFVIASANRNSAPVLAYVENGNYTVGDAEYLDCGFQMFINTINEGGEENKDDDKDNPGDGSDEENEGNGLYSFEVMSPLLKTKWNQTDYNTYCPDNRYIGCVVTAVSQICSFLETPKHISYQNGSEIGSVTIDWDKVAKECVGNDGLLVSNETKEQVARLMRYWGIAFDATYSENETSVDTEKAIKTMKNQLGFNVTGLADYDVDNVISDLKSGNKIVLMRGNADYYHVGFVIRNYTDGHAWVVDGYIDHVKNNKNFKYLHCNWGWGQKNDGSEYNGYFLSNVLNAEQAPVYSDSIASTRSSNYRYNLQTATFTK